MPLPTARWRPWCNITVATMGGALIPLSMAPYQLWPAAVLGLLFIALSLRNSSPLMALLYSFAAGMGLFGVGVSWVYVAITHFGSSSPALAVTLTGLFVVGLAFVLAAPFYLYGRWLSRHILGQTIGFSALWVLGEWLRSWLLTGFPWLYVGYGFIDTPLKNLAPITGVFGISLAVCLSATSLLAIRAQGYPCLQQWQQWGTWQYWRGYNATLYCGLATACLWLGSQALSLPSWSTPKPYKIHVGLMQPNIPQERKWDPEYFKSTLKIFKELSDPLWTLDWVIWPEAAVPYPYHEALPLINQLDQHAKSKGTVFITGIIYDDYIAYKYYNAIIARGLGSGEYFKQRLVPFGEYVPFEEQLRGLIAFFDLPTSIIHVGPFSRNGLNANGVSIAAAICYEIVYPDLIASLAQDKDVILTISNDAWFGHSNGPLQHFDMARMRALETGRYVIRGTNNGLSGFIAPNGDIINTGGRFTRENIIGQVERMSGATPFMLWHSWPIAVLALLFIICCAVIQKNQGARPNP